MYTILSRVVIRTIFCMYKKLENHTLDNRYEFYLEHLSKVAAVAFFSRDPPTMAIWLRCKVHIFHISPAVQPAERGYCESMMTHWNIFSRLNLSHKILAWCLPVLAVNLVIIEYEGLQTVGFFTLIYTWMLTDDIYWCCIIFLILTKHLKSWY